MKGVLINAGWAGRFGMPSNICPIDSASYLAWESYCQLACTLFLINLVTIWIHSLCYCLYDREEVETVIGNQAAGAVVVTPVNHMNAKIRLFVGFHLESEVFPVRTWSWRGEANVIKWEVSVKQTSSLLSGKPCSSSQDWWVGFEGWMR